MADVNATSTVESLFGVSGKTVLITGGSRGIGQMIADGFVRAGARVYISSRKADVCDSVAKELGEFGECYSIPADVGTQEGCEHLCAEIAAREEKVHVLINNAGNTWGAPLDEFPYSAFDRVWSVNVQAPFFITQRLRPQLRAAATPDDPGRVINIGSVNGIDVPQTDNFSYSASKAGVHMLTRHLASALARDAITVNAIAPGLFPSKMTAYMWEEEGFEQQMVDAIPLGRIGRPGDMAGTAMYLASRAASYVTGHVLVVDGGLVGAGARSAI